MLDLKDEYTIQNIEDLKESVKNFHLKYCVFIMYDLIDLYLNECDFNEGQLDFDFLVKVYNYLIKVESLLFRL